MPFGWFPPFWFRFTLNYSVYLRNSRVFNFDGSLSNSNGRKRKNSTKEKEQFKFDKVEDGIIGHTYLRPIIFKCAFSKASFHETKKG